MAFRFNPLTATLDLVGTSGTGTGDGTQLLARIPVTPSPDGVTTLFTVPDTFIAGSLTVYLNGLAEHYVTETTTSSFTFDTAPLSTDDIHVSYEIGSVSAPSTSYVLLESGDRLLLEDGSFLDQE